MKTDISSRRHRRNRRSVLAALGAIAAGVSLPGRAFAAEEKKLSFYNWDTYIGETTLEEFRVATGIEVKMDLFGDNSELFAKIREGNPGYDVIVPSNDFVDRMGKAGLLEPLNRADIPNFSNIAPEFQDAEFDRGRKYSMPYMWGTMGLAYRKSALGETPTSWSTVWGPESDKHAGRIAWISEPSSMIGMTMQYLGKSFNSTEDDDIRAAAAQLIKYKKNVKVIAEDNGQDLLASGEVDIAVEWNGDIAQLYAEDPDIGYIIPQEGSYLWQDCLAIPTGAPHPENAHAFINFLLDAEVGRDLAEYIEYATPNNAARQLTSESYRNNPIIFPTAAEIATLSPSLYLGEKRSEFIDAEWTRILSA